MDWLTTSNGYADPRIIPFVFIRLNYIRFTGLFQRLGSTFVCKELQSQPDEQNVCGS